MKQKKILDIASETREFLHELGVWPEALDGACGVAAYCNWIRLNQMAKFAGSIKTFQFVMGVGDVGGHCWNEVNYGGRTYVLDVTATQFCNVSCQPVIWEPIDEYTARDWFDSVAETIAVGSDAIGQFDGWPHEQRPSTYKKQIIKRFGIF